jgi:hypothetical protein
MDVFGDRDQSWKEPINRLKRSPLCHSIHTIEWTFFPGEDRLKERNA